MPDDLPPAIGEIIPDVLLHLVRPDLMRTYREEKERHCKAKKEIDQAMKRARASLHRLFGPLRERKEAELQAEYVERVQQEDDQHDRFMQELGETIRNHRDEPKR